MINPIGWDSFGLPAETAALQRGIPPKKWTESNIKQMSEQLVQMGVDFNWELELATSKEDYYKHTQ